MTREERNDVISRAAVLDAMRKNHRSGGRDIDGDYVEGNYSEHLYDDIVSLPPVTPQPKIGRWIKSTGCDDIDHFYVCSECGRYIKLNCGAKLSDYPYCHCGVKMQEVEE